MGELERMESEQHSQHSQILAQLERRRQRLLGMKEKDPDNKSLNENLELLEKQIENERDRGRINDRLKNRRLGLEARRRALLADGKDTKEIDDELDDLNLQLTDLDAGISDQDRVDLQKRLDARRKKRIACKEKGTELTEADKEDLVYDTLCLSANNNCEARSDIKKRLEARRNHLKAAPHDAVDMDEEHNLELQLLSVAYDEEVSKKQNSIRDRLAKRRAKNQEKKSQVADSKAGEVGEELAQIESHLTKLHEGELDIDEIHSLDSKLKNERELREKSLKARLAARRAAAKKNKDSKAEKEIQKELEDAQKEKEMIEAEEQKIAEETLSTEQKEIAALQKQKEVLENTLETNDVDIAEMNSQLETETAKHLEISNKLADKLVEERAKQSNRLKERLAAKRKRMVKRGEIKAAEIQAQEEEDNALAEELIRVVEDKTEVSEEMINISETFDGEKASLIKSLEHEQKSQREKLKARIAARKAKKGHAKNSKKHAAPENTKIVDIYKKAEALYKNGSDTDYKKQLQQLLIEISQSLPNLEVDIEKKKKHDLMKEKLKAKIAANPELAEKYRQKINKG